MSATTDHAETSGPPPPEPETSDVAVKRRGVLSKKSAACLLALVAVAALVATAVSARGWRRAGDPLRYHALARGDLSIKVTERGSLESRKSVEIKCEVDDVPGDVISGTMILWLAPNGSMVKKGELLVELDAAPHKQRLDDQMLETEGERASQLQATARYDNRITQNETALANAKLRVKLAELDLQSFEDEDGGVFQLELQDVEMDIQLAEAAKLIKDTDLKGQEMLFELGYSSSGDVAQARLGALSAGSLLTRALSERKLQIQYEHEKRKLQLDGALKTANRNLIQVERDNESQLAQAVAAKHAADRRLEKAEELLARYRDYVEKCKISAPQEGMVAYADRIREGEAVYQMQTILTLPTLTEMQVKMTVHESGINQIRLGMPATIRLDARPGVRYKGSVKSIAVLPDQSGWLQSDVKVYETVVTIDEQVKDVQPGMTAVVEINVGRRQDVLMAPVQAIVQIDGDDWSYVDAGDGVERRRVTLGATNDRFVEIQSGLAQGDRVVLNPAAIPDEGQQEEQTISPDNSLSNLLR